MKKRDKPYLKDFPPTANFTIHPTVNLNVKLKKYADKRLLTSKNHFKSAY